MRTKQINRCIKICNTIILNPKYKHDLVYIINVLEQERIKNKLRVEGRNIENKEPKII